MSADPSHFLKGRTRETKIRRDAAGRWFNDGDRIDHPNLTRSFDGWIDRAEDDRFCLTNSINWAYVAIEGPAYFVRNAVAEADEVQLVLSGDLRERLDVSTLCQDDQGALWCAVREGRCPARFDNHAVGKLTDLIEEDDQGVYLQLAGRKIRPPMIDDPLSLGRQGR